MFYFVKSELPRDKVEEFTGWLAKGELHGPEGNLSFVTRDGCCGYDLIECRDENECQMKYNDLVQHGLKIDEMTPIEPMSQFIEEWEKRGQSST